MTQRRDTAFIFINVTVLALFGFLLLLLFFLSATATGADCATVRRCLESPYGPGMAPGCADHIAAIQAGLVRGEGLPACDSGPQRDYASGWYWRSMGWEQCPADIAGDHPAQCGTYRQTTLPLLIPFVPGTAQVTEPGAALLDAIREKLATGQMGIQLTAVSESPEGLASESLAQARGRSVAARLEDLVMAVEQRDAVRNFVKGGLHHGVWLSAIGRGLPANLDVLGRAPAPDLCGQVEIRAGRLSASLERAVAQCGYVLTPLVRDGTEVDHIETSLRTVQAGNELAEVLDYFTQQYGLVFRINDFEVQVVETIE